jgi:hypothetical protein
VLVHFAKFFSMKITIDLHKLPLFLDGSDGSLWRARLTPAEQWAELDASDPDMKARRFVSVADILTMADKDETK